MMGEINAVSHEMSQAYQISHAFWKCPEKEAKGKVQSLQIVQITN